MALEYGSAEDVSGMSLTMFQAMDEVLGEHLLDAIENAKGDEKEMLVQALLDAQDNWKKLAFCISKGVIDHITSNMEIKGIRTIQQVKVQGDTETAIPSAHKHSIDIAAEEDDLVFEELDYPPGEGHVA
jgi:hypothetical protein